MYVLPPAGLERKVSARQSHDAPMRRNVAEMGTGEKELSHPHSYSRAHSSPLLYTAKQSQLVSHCTTTEGVITPLLKSDDSSRDQLHGLSQNPDWCFCVNNTAADFYGFVKA